MAKKLFVGGLPYETSNAELEKLFSEVGKVESATVITDRNTGRSRGFGFVELEKDEDAAKAIEKFNGSEVGSRNIVVAEAKPREEQPGGEPEEPKEEQPEREEPEKPEEPEKSEEPKE